MEPSADGTFEARDRRAATNFADAARAAGVARVVYLGGLVPEGKEASMHLASRLEVERLLHDAAPASVALRASIVIGAHSRSFRFLVRLVERVPVMPLPAWRDFRTRPIDARDVLAFLLAAATTEHAKGQLSLDIAGPDVVTYGELVARIRDALLLGRPPVRLRFNLTPVASRVAAAIAGESIELVGPLMEGLNGDLLPRDDRAADLLGVRLHSPRRGDRALAARLGGGRGAGRAIGSRRNERGHHVDQDRRPAGEDLGRSSWIPTAWASG